MTWPTTDVNTTNADSDTDQPLQARADILDLIQKFNQLRTHVPAYMQGFIATTTALLARNALGLGSIATQSTSVVGFTTGDVKAGFKTVADSGWVMMNDLTIGDALSGATGRANADTQALFILLWTNVTNTWCAVSGGRGISAVADWNAHKTIALPKILGRALASAGAGAGLTLRALGEQFGEEGHILIVGEMPQHDHDTAKQIFYSTPGVGTGVASGDGMSLTTDITGLIGNNQPHNTIPPTTYLNFMVKL